MTTANTAPTDYLAHLEAWKTDRLAKLTAADGWLNITDRLWLHPATRDELEQVVGQVIAGIRATSPLKPAL